MQDSPGWGDARQARSGSGRTGFGRDWLRRGIATGWNAPLLEPWFAKALDAASETSFGSPCGFLGQGGTIPLMSMLEKGFPKAQFMVCGVLGPHSNAHGPNEFLHVPYAQKLTSAVSRVIAAKA